MKNSSLKAMFCLISATLILQTVGLSCFNTCAPTENCICSDQACDSANDKNAIGGYGLDECQAADDSCVLMEFFALDEKLKKVLVTTPGGCSSNFDVSSAFLGFEGFPNWVTDNTSTITNYTCRSEFCNLPSLDSCKSQFLEGNGKQCVLTTTGQVASLTEVLLTNKARDEDAISSSGRAAKSCVQAIYTGGDADVRCDVCEERGACDASGVLLVDQITGVSDSSSVGNDDPAGNVAKITIIAVVAAVASVVGIGCWVMGSRRGKHVMEKEQKKKDESIKQAIEITPEAEVRDLVAVPVLGAGFELDEENVDAEFDYVAEKEMQEHMNATVFDEL